MKYIKGFIILGDGIRLAVSKIIMYDSVFELSRIYCADGNMYTSKYTLEEIDEAIIKAQL